MTKLKTYLGGFAGACTMSLFALSSANATSVSYQVGNITTPVQFNTVDPLNPIVLGHGDYVLMYDDQNTESHADDIVNLAGTSFACVRPNCSGSYINADNWPYGVDLSGVDPEYEFNLNLNVGNTPFAFQILSVADGNLFGTGWLALVGGYIWQGGVRYEVGADLNSTYNWAFQLSEIGGGTGGPGGPGGGNPGTEVPEPATVALLGAGMIGLARRRRAAA